MKYFVLMSMLIFNISCSTDSSEYQGYTKDYRSKSYLDIKHVGSTCNFNCIYSKFAVDLYIQEKQYDCIEGPCACVKINDAYTLCQEEVINSFEEEQEQNIENTHSSVPYYNQYDNQYYPSATCQNTSIAMVLSYYQYDITPDEIYLKWGKDQAQSPSGLNFIYTSYAANSRITTNTNASPEDLISGLSSGYIAIVHGYFTSYGHVIVVTGYDDEYYYVNDPAGKWNQCFKCGYTGEYNGKTKYKKEDFEKAVFTSNGSSYLPGWIHLIKGT